MKQHHAINNDSSRNWQTLEFEKCLKKVIYTNKIHRKNFKKEGRYPIISQEKEFINGYWNEEKDLFKVDKPVVIFGDHTQVIKFVDFDFVLGADGVKILKPKNDIDSKYFYYFLHGINLRNLGYARHYRLLRDVNIPLPPLTEQKRIVAILDQAFGEIEKVKANTEQNLKNAKELFQSYLQGVFENKGDDWEEKKLGEVCEVLDKLRKPITKKDRIEGEYPYYGATGILSYINNFIFSEKLVLIGEDGAKWESGDKTSFIAEGKYWVNNHAHVIKLNRELVLDEWIVCFLNFSDLRPFITGMTVPKLNQEKMRSIPIPLPPLSEQKAIVQRLDALRAETQRLESIYRDKLLYLEELKKSILQKAFSGEL